MLISWTQKVKFFYAALLANNQNNKYKRAEILKIHGSIKPHEAYISRQDLYTFYEKNGFIEEGKLFKRISYHAVNG